MLKSKITKAEFDALPEALRAYYKETNGSYVLLTDEAEELRTGAARAREERDTATARLAEMQAQIDAAKAAEIAAQEEAARKAKDIPAIEASWQTKLDAAVADGKAQRERLETMLRNLLVEAKAVELASEISTSPKLILPHLRERLRAEIDGDAALTRVLDANGKPSALSLEDLKKEFVANKEFAAIIKGTDATGGGAGQNGNPGGGAVTKPFNQLTEAERVALHRENPTEFARLRAAAQAAA